MSVEDRLLVLLTQARQGGNAAALADPSILRSQMSSQAPDLHGEIQALAAALAMGAPARIAAAVDPATERQSVATEIAQKERLSMGVVRPALDVACVAGPGAAAAQPATPKQPQANGWAGDSVVVGADAPPPAYSSAPANLPPAAPYSGHGQAPPPYPQYAAPPFAQPDAYGAHPNGQAYPSAGSPFGAPGAAQPFYRQTWFFGVVGAAIVLAAFSYSQSGVQQPLVGPNPGPVGPVQPPVPSPVPVNPNQPADAGQYALGGPELAAYGGNLPALIVQQNGAIGFNMTVANSIIRGVVVLPPNNWNAGQGTVIVSNGQAQSAGTGQFVGKVTNVPMRVMQVQWQQDAMQAGAVVVGFEGQQGQQDVALAGSVMCIMDGATMQPVGCGRVQGR